MQAISHAVKLAHLQNICVRVPVEGVAAIHAPVPLCVNVMVHLHMRGQPPAGAGSMSGHHPGSNTAIC